MSHVGTHEGQTSMIAGAAQWRAPFARVRRARQKTFEHAHRETMVGRSP